jgi:L,D-transpeptidase catalytic domain
MAVAALAAVAIAIAVFAGGTQRAVGSATLATPPHRVKTVRTLPRQPAGVQVAWAEVGSVPVYGQPSGSPEQSLSNPNSLGAPLVMLVHATRQGWVEVYLPERPNESLGWVPSADVRILWDDEHIVVHLDQRVVELFRGYKMVFESTAAVGSPDSPTPTGYFYVTEVLKLTEPDSAYGPYALGLSGFSGTYQTFDGGPGQIAIHGTDEPSSIGGYASHGCVRLSNPQITVLAAQVQAGTPVSVVD